MITKSIWRLVSIVCLFAILLSLGSGGAAQARPTSPNLATAQSTQGSDQSLKPVVRSTEKVGESIAVRDMPPGNGASPATSISPARSLPNAGLEAPAEIDPAVQDTAIAGMNIPAPIVNVDGMNNIDGVYPPDTVGDVGPNHFVQMVNSQFAIYNKSGVVVQAARPINSLFAGFGGLCQTTNNGDPIVLYDQFADRWLMSQFAFTGDGTVAPYYQCIAISKTGDPTGAYWLYGFQISNTKFNDYPHFGVWPDGYYMTINQFTGGASWGGAAVVAFDRTKMMAGQPASMVLFDLFAANQNFGGMLPADADGTTPPPAGAAMPFFEVDDSSEIGPADAMRIWKFHVDWVTPANSTFGLSSQPNHVLPVAAFNRRSTRISQQGTAQGLDAIGDRLMHRVQYRNFGDHDAVVLNHTADVGGVAGVRWYEVRDPLGTPTIYQQGTYMGPTADGINRWMASVAMDQAGNLGVGYSAGGSTMFAGIRYTARSAGDPLGTLPQGEGTIINGLGAQTGPAGRWGDYSQLSVDPVDDCTFWYTTEYMPSTSAAGWQTRIGSFKLDSCFAGPGGTLKGQVTNSVTTAPIPNATVSDGVINTLTNASGDYQVDLPVGSHNVTASAFGYTAQTVNNIAITDGVTTTQNFVLAPLPPATVQGVVTDSGHGWPLYARIDITSSGPTQTIYTNPATGAYTVQLIQGVAYNFTVQAISTGYTNGVRAVTPAVANSTENFVLAADLSSCVAPGYFKYLLSESFSSGTLPVGWTNIDNVVAHATPQAWLFNDPGARTNLTGGTGLFATLNSDFFGTGNSQDAELRTPAFSTVGRPTINLEFDTDFRYLGGETADIDVSTNGGTSWTNVWKKTAAYRGPKHEVVDISATAANQASVMVRFHYYGATWEWWWQVDNFKVGIGAATCDVLPGGLLVGNVTDANTTSGLNGATVTSVANPAQTTSTIATPNDPNVADGFYILFSPTTGAQSFTASKTGYTSQTQTPAIVANGTVVQNFVLGAGHLKFGPAGMTVTLNVGQSTNRTLIITNTGSVSATYTLTEYAGKLPAIPIGLPRIKRDSGKFIGTSTDVRDTSTGFWVGPRSGTEGPLVASPLVNPWVTTLAMPTGLSRPGAAIVNSKVYVIGGESTGGIAGGVAIYDPALVSWSAGPTMGVPTSNVCATAVGTDIYALGGTNAASANTNLLQVLHTTTNTWETVATDPLPGLRFGTACTTHNGKIYMFGGDSTSTTTPSYTNTAYVFDPAAAAGARWTALANMPIAAHFGGVIAINGKIYYAGMRNATADLASVFAYDVAAGTWATLPSLQTARGGANVWANGSTLYVGGGGWTTYLTSVEAYDTSAVGSWSFTNPLSQGRRAFAAVTDQVNGVLYAIGGWVGTYLANVEINRVPVDVLWLSETPVSGPVNAGATQSVAVGFNATGLAEGTYYAQIKTLSSTPYVYSSIPVTLTVTPATVFGVAVSPNATLSGVPGATVSKTITVTNTGTTADTFNLSHTSIWTVSTPASVGPLAPGASGTATVQVTIAASALNGDSDVATITATSQGDITKTASVTITTTAVITQFKIFLPFITR